MTPAAPRWALAAALATAACLPLRGDARSPPDPATRRADHVAAHPELSAAVRAAVLDGRVVPGMTVADVRAALGPEHRRGVSSDSRYELELEYRIGHRGTRTTFEGGRSWTEDIETGATQCAIYLRDDVVADATCAGYHHAAPVPVAPGP